MIPDPTFSLWALKEQKLSHGYVTSCNTTNFSPCQFLAIIQLGNIKHWTGNKNKIPVIDVKDAAHNVDPLCINARVAYPYQLVAVCQHAFYYPITHLEVTDYHVIEINCVGCTCAGIQVRPICFEILLSLP